MQWGKCGAKGATEIAKITLRFAPAAPIKNRLLTVHLFTP